MTKTAIYLRSSKDRSDVSIASQRRELQTLALSRNLQIVREYTDIVESAKSEFRPGFQELLRDLKAQDRVWTALLMTDTSRLSRGRYVAQVFKHEARKRGVAIIYSKVPEVDPISAVILDSVLEAMDEVHSLMSKEKGLAGMAENTRQGYRAGGRAPHGYCLVIIETDAIREGKPVTKTRLQPDGNAGKVARYLKARAAGLPRRRAREDTGISLPDTTLISMEWNALTYAGHNVWNKTNERIPGAGYKGNTKMRPRSDWVIQENTHPALITTDEAEAILQHLATSTRSQARRTPASYLLTGLLKTPDGHAWHGEQGRHYRPEKDGTGARRPRIDKEGIEEAVSVQVIKDLQSPAFIRSLTQKAREYYEERQSDPAENERQTLLEITHKISRNMDLAEGLQDPGPALRKIDELEKRRKELEGEIRIIEAEYTAAAVLAGITEDAVARMLNNYAGDIDRLDRERFKDILAGLVEKVIFDPTTSECRIHYKIGIAGDSLASPKLRETIPAFGLVSCIYNV